jgi:glycosyltransferase involved in cell wall biosynthesis
VAARILRYYGREAEVIEPPVDASFYTPAEVERPGEYDLVVSALAPYKRLDLALEAYRGTGRPLRIVGTGPEEARLRALAPPEVRFLGRVDDAELRELYRGCRAVLMPGIEDFGIVPLEAMACGRPAVVFGEGGGAETVEHGRTGLVFREPRAEALRAAVSNLETHRFDRLALRKRAEEHRREAFEARIRAFVQAALEVTSPRC